MTVIEEAAVKLIDVLLDVVPAAFLHEKIDEQAEIRAARTAADAEAAAKFGVEP